MSKRRTNEAARNDDGVGVRKHEGNCEEQISNKIEDTALNIDRNYFARKEGENITRSQKVELTDYLKYVGNLFIQDRSQHQYDIKESDQTVYLIFISCFSSRLRKR
jgi:hypothetical protein